MIVGVPSAASTRALAEEVTTLRFMPGHVLAVAAPDDAEAAEAVALLRDRVAINGAATAYVCEHFACKLPVTTPEALAAQLAG